MASLINNEKVLSTSQVAESLGFNVSVAFLKSCGVSPMVEQPSRAYWRASDFPLICHAISRHIDSLASRTAGE